MRNLVAQFLSNGISRRDFVRRLVAAVSAACSTWTSNSTCRRSGPAPGVSSARSSPEQSLKS